MQTRPCPAAPLPFPVVTSINASLPSLRPIRPRVRSALFSGWAWLPLFVASIVPAASTAADVRAPGTVAMAERLAEINATVDPSLCYHMNGARAEQIQSRIAMAPPQQKGPLRFQYANELLNAGRTEDAIAEIESLLSDIGVGDGPIPDPVRAIYEILAVAYMRLGEQENCVLQHSVDSCLFPIQGKGVHQLPRGSRGALTVYERLLGTNPQDLSSRYLLNVAHMTLGQYPDSVPAEYLIPESAILGSTNEPFPRFLDVAGTAGVAVTGLSGGCCIEDFDGDGLLDIFATAYGVGEQVRFFVNRGDGGFEDRTEAAGLLGIVGGLNAVHADYDNDGRPDILVLRGGWLGKGGERPNSLLRNLGDGRFADVSFEAGLSSERPTQTAGWGDIDGDGWLDLFIGNESRTDRAGTVVQDYPCELYHNDGDGTFTEMAAPAGLDLRAFVKGVGWGDIDGDGWLDLYVSVLGGTNRLYMNRPVGSAAAGGATSDADATDADASGEDVSRENASRAQVSDAEASDDDVSGEGVSGRVFAEVGASAGVTEPFFSFPTWFFDYDNDGDLDLFVSGYDVRRLDKVGADYAAPLLGLETPAERPRLYRNRGDGTFESVGQESGLTDVVYSMGSNFGDVDMDGFLDIYVGTGAPDFRSIVPNKMYRNVEGARFEDVTTPGGFGHIQKGHGVAFADLDNDGDQDVYAVMGGAYQGDVYQNVLFESPGFGTPWVTLLVEGTESNRSAIGARIEVRARGTDGSVRSYHRVVTTGGSFGSSSLQQEIGLGDSVEIESVTVVWPLPSRTRRTYTGITAGRRYHLVESSGDAAILPGSSFELGRPGMPSGGHDHHHHH